MRHGLQKHFELKEDRITRELGSLTGRATDDITEASLEIRSRVHAQRSLLGKPRNQKI